MSMAISDLGGAGGLHAMSGASAGLPPQQKMTSLFDKIDTAGTGSITEQQFNQAFQTFNPPPVFQQQGAGAIFSALDRNGTGSVTKQDFVTGMSSLMVSLRAEGTSSAVSAPSTSQTLGSSLQSLNSVDPNSVPSNSAPGTYFSLSA
jgi:hypothetical protein